VSTDHLQTWSEFAPPSEVAENSVANPFADTAPNSVYFENDARVELQARITHFVEYTQSVLFIEGVRGVGKTTFLRRLASQAGPDWLVATVRADESAAHAPAGSFLDAVATGFGYTSQLPSGDAGLDLFAEFAAATAGRNLTLVLLVDDAENLSSAAADALALLAEPVEGGRPLVRVVLFGQSLPNVLVEQLPKAENGSEPVQRMPLPVLDLQDVSAYLERRVVASGWADAFPFTPDQVAQIHAQSGGLFPAIDRLAAAEWARHAGTVLSPTVSVAQAAKPAEPPRQILLWIAALVAIGAIGFLFVNRTASQAPQSLNATPPASREAQKEVQPAVVSEPVVAPLPSPVGQESVAASSEPPAHDIPQSAVAPRAAPPPVETVVAAAPKIPLAPPPAPEPVVASPATPAAVGGAPVVQGQEGVVWVQSRNPAHFTLQLAAVVTLEGAKTFVAQHGLNDALIYRVTRAGREWAVVVSGDYADMKSAQLATQSLPPALTKSKPWARRFAVLQKELVDQPTPIN